MPTRNFRAEFEAAFPDPILSHADLKAGEDRLPEGFIIIPNATGERWDVVLPNGLIIDVVNGRTNQRQWNTKEPYRYNWDTGKVFQLGGSQGEGTSSSSSSGPTGSATPQGYIDNDGVARNDDGSIDVEGQCAIRGGSPFASPEGYHRCDAPVTGYAARRSDPFSLDMTDLISAGQKQALAASEKEKNRLRFGGRRGTILAGFGAGTPANRRTTLLGSEKGKLVPRGADVDLGPGNPRSDGTLVGSQARNTTLLGVAAGAGGGATGTESGSTRRPPLPNERPGRPGSPVTSGTENREDTGRKARPRDPDNPATIPSGPRSVVPRGSSRTRQGTLLGVTPTAQQELTPRERRASRRAA